METLHDRNVRQVREQGPPVFIQQQRTVQGVFDAEPNPGADASGPVSGTEDVEARSEARSVTEMRKVLAFALNRNA